MTDERLPESLRDLPPSDRYQHRPGRLDRFLPGGAGYTGAMYERKDDAGKDVKPKTRKSRKARKRDEES